MEKDREHIICRHACECVDDGGNDLGHLRERENWIEGEETATCLEMIKEEKDKIFHFLRGFRIRHCHPVRVLR